MFRVLLADDESMSLISTERSFPWDEYGFDTILKVSDSARAMELLKAQRIDAAFLDIRMPGLSGLDIIRLCRERQINTEFILVSGYSDFTYAKTALQLGVLDFCVKPVQPEETAGLLPKLAERLWQARLAGDGAIYEKLKTPGDVPPVLARCGLDAARGPIWALEMESPDRGALSANVAGEGREMTLALSATRVVKLVADDGARFACPGDCAMAVCRVQDPEGQLPLVLKLLHVEMQKAKHGAVLMVDPAGAGVCNESFLDLLHDMETRYTDNLSLRELAARHNLNYSYCSELFSKVLGTNFTRHLNTLRLAEARALLKHTNAPLEQVASRSGFSSYHYFTSVFKKAYHSTPSAYRKEEKA